MCCDNDCTQYIEHDGVPNMNMDGCLRNLLDLRYRLHGLGSGVSRFAKTMYANFAHFGVPLDVSLKLLAVDPTMFACRQVEIFRLLN